MPKLKDYAKAVDFTSRFSARDALKRLGLTQSVSIADFVAAYQARKAARKMERRVCRTDQWSLMQTAKRLGLRYGTLYFWVNNHNCPRGDWGILDFALNKTWPLSDAARAAHISAFFFDNYSSVQYWVKHHGAAYGSVREFGEWFTKFRAEKRAAQIRLRNCPLRIAIEKDRRRMYCARPEIIRRKYEQKKARMLADPGKKIECTLRARLSMALRRAKKKKTVSAIKLTGCTIPELRAYLESNFKRGMSWENHGKVWHIDHVIPCCKFDLGNQMEQQRCFHYLNLAPEYKEVNEKKNRFILTPSQIPLGLAA